MVGKGRQAEKVVLQDIEGAVKVGTRLMGEKRREENFKEFPRLPSIKAQSA